MIFSSSCIIGSPTACNVSAYIMSIPKALGFCFVLWFFYWGEEGLDCLFHLSYWERFTHCLCRGRIRDWLNRLPPPKKKKKKKLIQINKYNRHLGIDCERTLYGIWTIKPDYETITILFTIQWRPHRIWPSSNKEMWIFVKQIIGPFLPSFVTWMYGASTGRLCSQKTGLQT